MSSSGDRVEATRMKRVAFTDTQKCHAGSSHGTMLLNRFHGVYRAGGMKAAGGREHRGNQTLVELQDGDEEVSHGASGGRSSIVGASGRLASRRWSSFSTFRSTSAQGASSKALRGLKTRSKPYGKRSLLSLTHSRNRRLMRLRATALPKARGQVKPKRAGRSTPVLR